MRGGAAGPICRTVPPRGGAQRAAHLQWQHCTLHRNTGGHPFARVLLLLHCTCLLLQVQLATINRCMQNNKVLSYHTIRQHGQDVTAFTCEALNHAGDRSVSKGLQPAWLLPGKLECSVDLSGAEPHFTLRYTSDAQIKLRSGVVQPFDQFDFHLGSLLSLVDWHPPGRPASAMWRHEEWATPSEFRGGAVLNVSERSSTKVQIALRSDQFEFLQRWVAADRETLHGPMSMEALAAEAKLLCCSLRGKGASSKARAVARLDGFFSSRRERRHQRALAAAEATAGAEAEAAAEATAGAEAEAVAAAEAAGDAGPGVQAVNEEAVEQTSLLLSNLKMLCDMDETAQPPDRLLHLLRGAIRSLVGLMHDAGSRLEDCHGPVQKLVSELRIRCVLTHLRGKLGNTAAKNAEKESKAQFPEGETHDEAAVLFCDKVLLPFLPTANFPQPFPPPNPPPKPPLVLPGDRAVPQEESRRGECRTEASCPHARLFACHQALSSTFRAGLPRSSRAGVCEGFGRGGGRPAALFQGAEAALFQTTEGGAQGRRPHRARGARARQ